MVKFLIFIGFIVLIIITLVIIIKSISFKRYIVNNFKSCNVVVFGKKGRGKDLLFQKVINIRKDYYYSNISYGGKHKIITLKDVSCEPNTYITMCKNEIVKTPHLFKESKDIYLSDIGNFLPSYMDSTLYKLFPSMPLLYSLSRHLYDNNIHCNSQSVERGWKALREQADFFVKCCGTLKLFGFLFITKCITYEKYDSAKQSLLPLKKRMFNKQSKAQYDLYLAQNGVIKVGYIFQFKKSLHYDTRAFEKILLKGRRKY